MDVFAAMGISGFGKPAQKRQLDPSRFDRNKRQEVSASYCLCCWMTDFKAGRIIGSFCSD